VRRAALVLAALSHGLNGLLSYVRIEKANWVRPITLDSSRLNEASRTTSFRPLVGAQADALGALRSRLGSTRPVRERGRGLSSDRLVSHRIDDLVDHHAICVAGAIRAEAEVTRREQLARLAYPNPAVTWSREGAGFTEFFQAEQSLPLFGVRASPARAGVAATAAAEADRDVRLWQLRAEAGAAVARFAAEQERAAVATAQVREIERLIDILRTREAEGEGSRFDRLRAEQELRARHLLWPRRIAIGACARAVGTPLHAGLDGTTRI
jgi:hypothetical protein